MGSHFEGEQAFPASVLYLKETTPPPGCPNLLGSQPQQTLGGRARPGGRAKSWPGLFLVAPSREWDPQDSKGSR